VSELSNKLAEAKRQLALRKSAQPQSQPQPGAQKQIPLPKQIAPKQIALPRPATQKKVDIQQAPPHSVSAEQGVLGSILCECQYQKNFETLRQVAASIQPWFFYVPAHKAVFEVMLSLYKDGVVIDLITFTQILQDRKLLDEIGGPGFITDLFTVVQTGANVKYYIDIVREKFILRETISTATRLVRAAYGAMDDEAEDILADFGLKIERIKRHAGMSNGTRPLAASDLQAMSGLSDPNSLVGWRWQCRGGNCLWSGGAGYGKSTLAVQFAATWAFGGRCFGTRPSRSLKSLILQSENDDFDVAEQYNGVLNGLKLAEDDRQKIEKNLTFIRVEAKSGRAFLFELERLLNVAMPDLVWIDPLFAFAGCDLMNAEKTGYFLREGLFPLFVKFGCCGNIVHHIAKPPREEKADKPTIDYQYSAFGSSEIQNAFRAVNTLQPISFAEQIFKLVFSKRGGRARAKNLQGRATTQIYIQQSEDPGTMFWTQVDAPEKPDKKQGAALKYSDQNVLEYMSIATGWKISKLQRHVREQCGMASSTFYLLWDKLKKDSKIRVDKDGEWFKKSTHESTQQLNYSDDSETTPIGDASE
jgi:hypothetical protein